LLKPFFSSKNSIEIAITALLFSPIIGHCTR
jgi:hypothetical protein